ncbi:MAG: GNAT family N-acetyltransferase [Pseudomonadota bacterium]
MPELLTVRVATQLDMAAVDALLARSYPRLLRRDYPPSMMVMALPLISRAQPLLLSSRTYYVAETESGAIIGAGGWTRRKSGSFADVRHVVTDDRAVRRGIGRTILNRVFEQAKAAGVTLLDCKSTRTAVPFYQALGFVALGPIEVPLGPGIAFPAMHMQRRL